MEASLEENVLDIEGGDDHDDSVVVDEERTRISKLERLKEAIDAEIRELEKTTESTESEDEEEEDERLFQEADWSDTLSTEVMTSPSLSQLLDSSVIILSPDSMPDLETSFADSSIMMVTPKSKSYSPEPPTTPGMSPHSSWPPMFPSPVPLMKALMNAKSGKRRRSRTSTESSSTPPRRPQYKRKRSTSTPSQTTSSQSSRLSPRASPFTPRTSSPKSGEKRKEVMEEDDSVVAVGEVLIEKEEEFEKKEEGEGEEGSPGERKERKTKEINGRIWKIAANSPEEVWNIVWDDINSTMNYHNFQNKKLIKMINPDHPVIKARTEFLSWGNKHEFITPLAPSIILPTVRECQKTIDDRMIGAQANHIKVGRVETFEANYKEHLELEENMNEVMFSTITSYTFGNTSKSMDCLNRLFLTPMEVRWLNLYVNEITSVVDVEWPLDAHIGQYNPDHFQGWLSRKVVLEETEVMSLKDQSRKLIQKLVNENISPYLKTCPCVQWA